MNQSVSIDQPFLPLFNRSWTFEAWIYLHNVNSYMEYSIVGQFDEAAINKYLHLVVRSSKLLLGFYSNDLPGATNLTALRWYHTAFAFDNSTRSQSVYLDGVLDGSQVANGVYQGTKGTLAIGFNSWSYGNRYFDGLIDQFSYTNRSKTSAEILRDATLTLSVSFDDNSIFDDGPLHITGSLVGSTSFVSGRQVRALQIDNVLESYFTVQGLVLLGRDGQSYSLSIWIKPAVQQKASIIHMSSLSDGTGWYWPMLGLTSGNLLIAASWHGSVVKVMGPVVPAHSWTHVVVTYRDSSGLRLYSNGSLRITSAPFSVVGSGTPNYLFVGSPRAAVNSSVWADISGQYSGIVDELRVYSRELTVGEINALANP